MVSEKSHKSKGFEKGITCSQNDLDSRKISPQVFKIVLDELASTFGGKYLQTLTEGGGNKLPVQSIDTALRDHKLVENTKNIDGFSSVRNILRNKYKNNDTTMSAEWFQLILANVFSGNGYYCNLEKVIESNPKDIFIPQIPLHVECKAFMLSHAVNNETNKHYDIFKQLIDLELHGSWLIEITDNNGYEKDIYKFFNQQETSINKVKIVKTEGQLLQGDLSCNPIIHFSLLERLTENIIIPGSICSSENFTVHFSGPKIELSKKVIDTIESKYRQLVKGVCNIIACDLSNHVGELLDIEKYSLVLFEQSDYSNLSAILLCRVYNSTIIEENTKKIVFKLIENPYASHMLNGEIKNILNGELIVPLGSKKQ